MPLPIFSILYSLGIAGLLINIFRNPNFLENIAINPAYFLLAFIFIGILILFTKKDSNKNSLFGKLLFINKYLIIPSSFIATIAFTTLELTHYPNYVFSTFKIFHFDFIYIFLLSYLAHIFTLGKETIARTYKRHVFALSLVLIFFFSLIFTIPHDFYVFISKEDGILENFQFIFYFTAGLFALLSIPPIYKSKVFPAKIYFLLGLGLIFIAFEEISWGQRITNYSIPLVQEANYKGEINIHNQSFIGFVLLQSAYILAGIYGSFSYFVLNKSKHWLNLISPSPEFFLYYFTLFLVYVYAIPVNRIYQEEVGETLFALGTMIFITRNFFLLKAKRLSEAHR